MNAESSVSPPLLLFVCAGNICRSPMAQAIATEALAAAGVAAVVESAGLTALVGHEAHSMARKALGEIGLGIDDHRARQITRSLVDGATLVITATDRQRDDLRYFFRGEEKKILSFDEVTGSGELVDPFGGGPAAFAETVTRLREGMPAIVRLLRERGAGPAGT